MFKVQKEIEEKIKGHWDDLNSFERLELMILHAEYFIDLGVFTREELANVINSSEGNLEYIIYREEQPLFKNINIKYTIDSTEQVKISEKVKTAIRAVFT